MGLTPQEALDLFRSDDLVGIGMAAMEVQPSIRYDARVVPLGQRFELVAQVLLQALLEQARVAAGVTNDVRRGLVEQ